MNQEASTEEKKVSSAGCLALQSGEEVTQADVWLNLEISMDSYVVGVMRDNQRSGFFAPFQDSFLFYPQNRYAETLTKTLIR